VSQSLFNRRTDFATREATLFADLRQIPDVVHDAGAAALVTRALHRDPASRPTLAELKRDPLFDGIDWEGVSQGKLALQSGVEGRALSCTMLVI
jgi:hypothetical protein